MWKVITSSNLNPPLKLFFYSLILTNNNLLLKIYCENIAVKFLNQDFLFFILFFFLSFNFHPFIHFFFFFLLVFLLHMSTVQCPISTPFFYFLFLLKNVLDIRERERERERERGRSWWIYRSLKGQSRCSTTTSAAPRSLVLLPTTRLGQIGLLLLLLLFFFFFFIFACSMM